MPRADQIIALRPEYAGCAILLAEPPPIYAAPNPPAAQRVIVPFFGGKIDAGPCLTLHT
jgi:hypothetical protein